MIPPDQVVVERLAAAGLGLTEGTNLFRGRLLAAGGGVPTRAVFALASGGRVNSRFLGSSKKVRELSVAIKVRSDAEDFAGGEDLAAQVLEALDHVATGLPAGYLDLRSDQPFPTELGQGENGAHIWGVNITLRYVGE